MDSREGSSRSHTDENSRDVTDNGDSSSTSHFYWMIFWISATTGSLFGALFFLKLGGLAGWVLAPIFLIFAAVGWYLLFRHAVAVFNEAKGPVAKRVHAVLAVINAVKDRLTERVLQLIVSQKAYNRLSHPKETVRPEDLPPSGRYTGTHLTGGEAVQRAYKLTFHTGGQIFGVVQDGSSNLMIRGRVHQQVCYWCETHQNAQHASIGDPHRCRNVILNTWPFHAEVTAEIVDAKKGKLQGKYYGSRDGIGGIELSYDDEEGMWSISVADDSAERNVDAPNEAGPSSRA